MKSFDFEKRCSSLPSYLSLPISLYFNIFFFFSGKHFSVECFSEEKNCPNKLGTNFFFLFSRRILKVNPPMPPGLSPEVSDFISKLLVKDPRKRLGGGEDDAEELKRHRFFAVSHRIIKFFFFYKMFF